MDQAPLVLAFTAGMVASLNPCGFSLLPSYVGLFVLGDDPRRRLERRVVRAVGVAAAVSVGFVVVFVAMGLVLDRLSASARRQLPWMVVAIGVLLLVAGIAVLLGWKPRLPTGRLVPRARGTGVGSMLLYGAGYAIASLSCTIGPFLAVTGAALDRSAVGGVATYGAYAAGMGAVIAMISIAVATAHTTVVANLRQLSRVATRLGGLLMVVAGAYAVWYGRWELAVYSGDLSSDPIVDAGESLRGATVDLVRSIGALRLAAGTAAIFAVALLVSLLHRERGAAAASPGCCDEDGRTAVDHAATRERA